MENEITTKQVFICFAINVALFLLASFLNHCELAGY